MLLVKAISGGSKRMHCLPQMMRVINKLGLDLDTHSLHPAYALRPFFVTVITAKDHTSITRPC